MFLPILFALNAHAQSITDLPALSKAMIHHYDCRAAILLASGASRELNFQISPKQVGHTSSDFTVAMGAEKVVASANAEMLGLVWTRNTQTIANAQAWAQNSTTQAFVLMVSDPQNDQSQVHLNCNGVTFDQVKAGTK